MNHPAQAIRVIASMAFSVFMAAPLCAFAQQPAAASTTGTAPLAEPAAFTQKDLDELLAPIALYPDALLAQILMASTYPLEIVEAGRWQKENPSLTGDALETALQSQKWDPSVKSLTAVPQVLKMMFEKLDWTQKLGDAFLAQQEPVMKTVQALRAKADAAGNLKSSSEMTVSKEKTENSVSVIKIEQPKPDVVYVPTYNPATVYGTWWYASPPPYYYYPPGYAYGAGLAFATGVVVGAAIWGNIGWGNNNVNVNVNKYNNFNKTNISNGNWNHAAEHRKGAAYRDSGTANKYNRGSDRAASQSREQFRGRADQGRSDLSSSNRSSASQQGSRAGTSDRGGGGGGDRAGASSRSSSAGASSRSSGSFSGAGGGGASTRAASSRGGASRGGGGGGRGGGGRR
jgi:hypothetical protein